MEQWRNAHKFTTRTFMRIIIVLLLLFDMCTWYYCRIRSETRLFAPIYRPTLYFVDLPSLLSSSTDPVGTQIVLLVVLRSLRFLFLSKTTYKM